MLNNIWFNGVSARDMGVRNIEHYPDLSRPERKVDVFDIPGRSGQIVFPQDAWENIDREYDIYAGNGLRGSAPRPFMSIGEWLNSANGYARLEDTYEPDVFRLAYCTGGFEAENAYTRFGRATITFHCRPERFLKDGEEETVLTSGTAVSEGDVILRNPTGFKAKPLIYISCTVSAGTSYALNFKSGGKTYQILTEQEPVNGIFVDCETMDVYDDTGANKNSFVEIDDFPVFHPGDVLFSTLKTNYTVKVIPRWYVI